MSEAPKPTASSPSGTKSWRRLGAAPAWFRIALSGALLIALPVAIYVFYYQAGRVDDATIRNFRALDAAAGRVTEVLENLSNVVRNHSFNVSSDMLDEVLDRVCNGACSDDFAMDDIATNDIVAVIETWKNHLQAQDRNPAGVDLDLKMELTYELAEFILGGKGRQENLLVWKRLLSLLEGYRGSYDATGNTTISVDVTPVPRNPTLELLRYLNTACSGPGVGCRPDAQPAPNENAAPVSPNFELLFTEPARSRCQPSTRLVERSGGLRVEITDCRPLRERSPKLHEALKEHLADEENHPVFSALDLFGVRSVVGLDRMLSGATSHLSRFFDSHLITDRQGHILFEIDAPPEFVSGMDVRQATALAFSNHVDLATLLSESAQSADGLSGEAERPSTASTPAGQSIVKFHWVRDVQLLVFLHPFIVNNIEFLETGDSPTGSRTPYDRVFYMVGVVGADDLRNEAMRLRLSWVVTATLLVLAILTLFPLLWFWTVGDRLTLGPWSSASIVLIPTTGVVLYVVLALGIVTNRMDENTLDYAAEKIAVRIKSKFNRELHSRIRALHEVAPLLGRPVSGSQSGSQSGNPLEDIFYCGPEPDTSPKRLPSYEMAFLIDERGQQIRCDERRLFRTQKLNLEFREYFVRPMEGRLWYPPTGRDDIASVPYFVERIDSIVQGEVATMLAMREPNRGRKERPQVAAAGIWFESLEQTALPPYFDFAVIDRENGRTLFHSDERRAMVTNFVRDVGAPPRLLSQLHAGTGDTMGLVYDGVPISAHIEPLREELPWTLIVYRDHEIEDRLRLIASSLTLFSVFSILWFVAVVGVAVVLWGRVGKRLGAPLRDLWLCVIVRWPVRSRESRVKVSRIVGASAIGLATVVFVAAVTGSLPVELAGWVAWGSVGIVVIPILWSRSAYCRPEFFERESEPWWITAAIIIGLTIVPTAAWFTYHRTQLSTGLDCYVRDQTNESAWRKQESYWVEARKYRQTQHVNNIRTGREFDDDAVPGMREHIVLKDMWEPCEAASDYDAEGGMFDLLQPVVAHSILANAMMNYRAAAGSNTGPASPYVMFEKALPEMGSLYDGWLLGLPIVFVLMGIIIVIAWSICAAVLGRQLPGTKLPVVNEKIFDLPNERCGPRRIVAECTNQTARQNCEKENYGRFSTVYRVRWTDTGIEWQPIASAGAGGASKDLKSLYVIEDLEVILTNEKRNIQLLVELEKVIASGTSVLIWTRVVPGYRLSTRAGDVAHRAFNVDRLSRWSRALASFEWLGVGESDDAVETRFDKSLKKEQGSTEEQMEIVKVMQKEAVANPDLLDIAVGVAREVLHEEPSDEGGRAVALQRFRARAEAHFNVLWMQSTLDERLQLHTFARGGLMNRRRTAALSSLIHRGLVHEDHDGVLRPRSDAFSDFIVHDLVHDDLMAWRKEGHGGVWKMIWPPAVIVAVLLLVFFFQSNPEMLSTWLTIMVAFLPFAVSLFRGQQPSESISTSSRE